MGKKTMAGKISTFSAGINRVRPSEGPLHWGPALSLQAAHKLSPRAV